MSRLPDVLPTPERLAKGDLEEVKGGGGHTLQAYAPDRSVLAWLIREEVLEPRDGDYAKAFEMCRHAHESKRSGFRSCLYLPSTDGAGDPVTHGTAASIYSKLLQWMSRRHLEAVAHAVDTPYSRFDYRLGQYDYAGAFLALSRRFKEARKHVKTADGLPEDSDAP